MTEKQHEPLAVIPGRGLGWMTLGASFRDIYNGLRAAQPRQKLKIQFAAAAPLLKPVNIFIPATGLRLRFDGSEQRLRLIEVMDFTKIPLTYNGQDLVKNQDGEPTGPPTFKHLYSKLFGPTSEGELCPDKQYVLSYPGIAFSFEVYNWPKDTDFVAVLASSASAAKAMSIFNGASWKDARKTLWTRACPISRTPIQSSTEIELALIKGKGHVEFRRRAAPSFHLRLAQTTVQDLIIDIGPPDEVYNKTDKRLSIHKDKTSRRDDMASSPDAHDTDRSSISTITDYSSHEDDAADAASDTADTEFFYNYFSRGFSILFSTKLNDLVPLRPENNHDEGVDLPETSSHHVATKVILYGNIPGAWDFSRWRRCRWLLNPTGIGSTAATVTSETPFTQIRNTLDAIWAPWLRADPPIFKSTHMVINRGWGDSPGSSVELLGGWEDAGDSVVIGSRGHLDGKKNATASNTELYSWPGLNFEVMKNDMVACLQVS